MVIGVRSDTVDALEDGGPRIAAIQRAVNTGTLERAKRVSRCHDDIGRPWMHADHVVVSALRRAVIRRRQLCPRTRGIHRLEDPSQSAGCGGHRHIECVGIRRRNRHCDPGSPGGGQTGRPGTVGGCPGCARIGGFEDAILQIAGAAPNRRVGDASIGGVKGQVSPRRSGQHECPGFSSIGRPENTRLARDLTASSH